MRFLLIHSPLVTSTTWLALTPALERAGAEVTVASLDNTVSDGGSYHEHHVDKVLELIPLGANESTVAVAHSGAGTILASVDPRLFLGHVFLDAIFPVAPASRFELFDDPQSVAAWREVARENNGAIPRDMLVRFGEQIHKEELRTAFTRSLADVPVALYEETAPLHPSWPSVRKGLYVRWTPAYASDAERVRRAGFELREDPGSHFKMLNQPEDLAEDLIRFARSIS